MTDGDAAGAGNTDDGLHLEPARVTLFAPARAHRRMRRGDAVLVVATIVLAALAVVRPDGVTLAVGAFVAVAWGWHLLEKHWNLRARVVFDDQGVHLDTPRWGGRFAWDEVERIEVRPLGKLPTRRGLEALEHLVWVHPHDGRRRWGPVWVAPQVLATALEHARRLAGDVPVQGPDD